MIIRTVSVTVATITAVMIGVLPAAGSPKDPSPAPTPTPTPGSGTTSYGAGAITVTSDGWIHYRSDLAALGRRAQTVAGYGEMAADGSCTESGTASGNSGATAVTTITVREQVAFNPATCESKYLVADLTPADGAVYGQHAPSKTTTNKSADTPTALALATHTRWFRTIWEDPIQIDITKETVAQQWNSSQVLKRQHAPYGFWGCLPGGYCPDRTYVDSSNAYYGNYSNRFEYSGVSHLHNSTFAKWVVALIGPAGWAACGFPTSSRADFYHDVQVIGYKSGTWDRAWHDSRKGACTNLVHHDEATGSTWPF